MFVRLQSMIPHLDKIRLLLQTSVALISTIIYSDILTNPSYLVISFLCVPLQLIIAYIISPYSFDHLLQRLLPLTSQAFGIEADLG